MLTLISPFMIVLLHKCRLCNLYVTCMYFDKLSVTRCQPTITQNRSACFDEVSKLFVWHIVLRNDVRCKVIHVRMLSLFGLAFLMTNVTHEIGCLKILVLNHQSAVVAIHTVNVKI